MCAYPAYLQSAKIITIQIRSKTSQIMVSLIIWTKYTVEKQLQWIEVVKKCFLKALEMFRESDGFSENILGECLNLDLFPTVSKCQSRDLNTADSIQRLYALCCYTIPCKYARNPDSERRHKEVASFHFFSEVTTISKFQCVLPKNLFPSSS